MITSLFFAFLIYNLITPAISWEFCEYVNFTNTLNHPHSLQCRICGPKFGSAPYACVAFEANFNARPLNEPIGSNYKTVQWEGLTAQEQSAANPIRPSSHQRYARTGSNGLGIFNFTGPGTQYTFMPFGYLLYFHYGCADASSPYAYTNNAVPCTLSVTSLCPNESYVTGDVTLTTYTNSYDFAPDSTGNATMASGAWDVPVVLTDDWLYLAGACENYTFQAVGRGGKDVFLYLDDVVLVHKYNVQLY